MIHGPFVLVIRESLYLSFQRKRLEGRGTETEESLLKRLNTAQEALEYGS